MATTYDDILSRAAEDMLTDTPEATDPLPPLVWCVEIDSPYPSERSVHLFHRYKDAAAYADSRPSCDIYIYQLEVR